MKRAAVVGGVVLVATGAWLLTRSVERDRAEPADAAAEDDAKASATSRLTEAAPLPAQPAREVSEDPANPGPAPTTLRGRVVGAATGAPLADCAAYLSFSKSLGNATTDADGRFEIAGQVLEGAELELFPPRGWEIEDNPRELDGLPREELLFLAHELPAGPVHGRVVDEITLEPVPYVTVGVGGESLETDVRGEFVGREPQPRGLLEFSVMLWGYEVNWDPAEDDAVIVPARIGPTFFVATGVPARANATWIPGALLDLHAFNPSDVRGRLELGPPMRVRFEVAQRQRPISGTLVVSSWEDYSCASAVLSPGCGSLAAPLVFRSQPCGFLTVTTEVSRSTEWFESLHLFLGRPGDQGDRLIAPAEGTEQASTRFTFVVLEPGECVLQAELDGKNVARRQVTTKLGEIVSERLQIELPELEEEEPGEPPVPFHGRVTSTSGRRHTGQVRLTRLTDGEGCLADLRWAKAQGVWNGTWEGEAPAGEYRIALELRERPFPHTGPKTVVLPATEEFSFTIEDATPLRDVYFAPIAAESGKPLLVYEAQLTLDDGQPFEGCDYSAPSVPVVKGHASTLPFYWVVLSPGRGPVGGRWEPDGGEGDVRIEVALERGWGAILYVGDSNADSLEGVRVLLDGVPGGVTRSDGYVCLRGERPQKMVLEYPGWELEDEYDDVKSDGSFDDSEVWMVAYLKRVGR